MRADDIRKDQMRYKEIEPNGISPNSTALGHGQPLWLPLVRPQGAREKGQLMVAIRILLRLFEINISITKA